MRSLAVAFAQGSAEAQYPRGLASRLAAIDAQTPVMVEPVALLDIDERKNAWRGSGPQQFVSDQSFSCKVGTPAIPA